jgi:hypothetical protein
VDRRCLQQALLHESVLRLHLHSLLEPPTEESLDIVRGQFGELGVLEHLSQVLQRALVNLVGFWRAEWGLGEVLQIKIRPLPKIEMLTAAQRGQSVVVAGLEPFPEAFLRFGPVLSKSRFSLASAVLVAVLHPPDLRSFAFVQAPSCFTGLANSPPPV